MYKIEIEFPNSNSVINQQEKPEGVEVILVEDEFLNATGGLFEVAINFILIQVTTGLLNKVGENIYEYLEKLILKNNEGKHAYDIKVKIKTDDFILTFDAKKLNKRNIQPALEVFSKTLNTFNETIPLNIGSDDLIYDENIKQWISKYTNIQKSIDEMRNDAMEKFNN